MSKADDSGRLTLAVGGRDHLHGSIDANLMLVEYGDYQCPQCGQAHGVIKEIQQYFGNRLCFVFRHFPLAQHPQAQKAAETAEIAGAQGKFWQMHDTLFEHQQALDDGSLVEYAIGLGLDVTQFLQDMSAHVYASQVDEDIRSGVSSGVTETPTFFINGIRHSGAWVNQGLLVAIIQAGNYQ